MWFMFEVLAYWHYKIDFGWPIVYPVALSKNINNNFVIILHVAAMTTIAIDMPFSSRLLALLRDPTSWEGLTSAQRRRAINDFLETQNSAVREHGVYRERLNLFFDDVYARAMVSVRIARLGSLASLFWPPPHNHHFA